jgi:hypothetical protein
MLGGFSKNMIKQQNLVGSVKGKSGIHLGAAMNFKPLRKSSKFSLEKQSALITRGYTQTIGSFKHEASLAYITSTLLAKYSFRFLSIQNGFSYEVLADASGPQFEAKYSEFDISWISGINLFENRRAGIYFHYFLGLKPVYNYYKFDKLGNFIEEIHDVKNRSLLFGIKVRITEIYDEK